MNPSSIDPQQLNLRDIHLPEPISWWPIAPGWWLIAASIILIAIVIYLFKTAKQKRQLKQQLGNDIHTELATIKQQFQQTHNKVQLAKALSILLRRASISYYPEKDIAGLTGNNWLNYLDNTHTAASKNRLFHSDIGKVLLSAPYLPETAELAFDAQALISLCESWLCAPHARKDLPDDYSGVTPNDFSADTANPPPRALPDETSDSKLTAGSDENTSPPSTSTSPLTRVTS